MEPKKTEKLWTAGEVREVEGGDLIILIMIKVMVTQKNDTWFLLSFSVRYFGHLNKQTNNYILYSTKNDNGDNGDDDDDDDGLPAYFHHDKIPPWWECVSNDKGGNVS